jgi:hypothetical protein
MDLNFQMPKKVGLSECKRFECQKFIVIFSRDTVQRPKNLHRGSPSRGPLSGVFLIGM